MDTNVIDQSKQYVEHYINEHGGTHLTYHNMEHTRRVIKAAEDLADEAEIDTADRQLLQLAAIYHDVGYCEGASGHELRSAEIASTQLAKYGLDQVQIGKVRDLIMSTCSGWHGSDSLCQLLVDADMAGLADSDYLMISEGLRKELSHLEGKEIDQSKWMAENIRFFEAHKYQSRAGKSLYKKAKRKNLKWLKKMAAVDGQSLTIASSKSAQTQLKTALRNHIDLSAIADNKANIMLSVNAIMITVGVPLLMERISTQPQLLMPTIILGITCLVSMIFATLSTRPQKMNGVTKLDQIKQQKTNLFFFGNFYQMKFEEYDEGMREVVADSEIMDNSITRDLFYLGKTLGKKFSQLRVCYNVFMIGIVLAVVSYGVQMLIGV